MPAIADLPRPDWHRLNRLLEAALTVDESERAAWLQQLPPADADLVPLLAKLLSATDRTETADFVARPPPLPAEEQPGQRIGPYRLLSPLGEGGMGAVWLAERADGAFERQVALKLPHAEWIDRGLAQRFARERAVLASLNHPNIAQLFDAGWSETGRPYLALEYVDGAPLLAWCEARRLDTAARLHLFVAVVRAVAHAHAHLVVHRDLKPSNVLVTADGTVKLLDFGIAKLLASDVAAAEETELTRLGGRALTPSYAAPEQILGQPITTAVDIYALGVMLFELLTGERPYRLGRADVQSRAALEEAIVKVDPATPSAAAKDKVVRRALRGDLDAIVLKALKKQPEERYQTAAALADDIERHLDHRPVQARRDSRAYRLRRFVVRNRYTVTSVTAVMLALVVGLAATLWQAKAARQEAEHANTIKQFVLSVIQQADPQASQGTRAADMALLDATGERVERELAGRPDLQLEVRLAIATAYRNRGEWGRARETMLTAVVEARGKVGEDNIDLLTVRIRLAEWPIVNSVKAQDEIESVVAVARKLGKSGVPLLIEALLARENLKYAFLDGYIGGDPAAPSVAEARSLLVALAEQTHSAGHSTVIRARILLARTLAHAGKREEAVDVLEPAYRAAQASALMADSHPLLLSMQAYYGELLCALRRCDEGIILMRDSVARMRAHHGPSSPQLSDALRGLAWASFHFRDYKQFVDLRREAYAVAAASEPLGSLRRWGPANNLALTLLEMWRPHEVLPLIEDVNLGIEALPAGVSRTKLELFRDRLVSKRLMMSGETGRARQLAEEVFGRVDGRTDASGFVFHAGLDLVTAMRLEGDAVAAESFAEKLMAFARGRSELDRGRYEGIGELAATKLDLGKWQEALTLLDEAVANRIAIFGQSALCTPFDAQHHLWRGQALLKLQRIAEARQEFKRVDAYWRDIDPEHPMTAEAAWWYGHALVATGQTARGKALVAAARPLLAASFLPHLRPLAEAPSPIAAATKNAPPLNAHMAAR